jgi:anti-sigma factor RsiW
VSGRALTCHEVIEILTDYLDDALVPVERRRVEEHLAMCDGCTAYLAQLRETIRLTGMVTEEEIPPEQKQQLLDAFRTWTRPDPSADE